MRPDAFRLRQIWGRGMILSKAECGMCVGGLRKNSSSRPNCKGTLRSSLKGTQKSHNAHLYTAPPGLGDAHGVSAARAVEQQ